MARKETTLEQDAYIRKHGAEMSASEIQRAIGLSRKIVKRRLLQCERWHYWRKSWPIQAMEGLETARAKRKAPPVRAGL